MVPVHLVEMLKERPLELLLRGCVDTLKSPLEEAERMPAKPGRGIPPGLRADQQQLGAKSLRLGARHHAIPVQVKTIEQRIGALSRLFSCEVGLRRARLRYGR